MKYLLIIAGSDPSGGAGVSADLKTASDIGVPSISAITALTAQDDKEVTAIHPTPADVLTQQLSTACRGKEVYAVKIGMIVTRANVRAVTWFLKTLNPRYIVVDPVFYSTSGAALIKADAFTPFKQILLPIATVVTPNLAEATALAGMQVAGIETMKTAAKVIYDDLIKLHGASKNELFVIIKGGHLEGDAIDILYDGSKYHSFDSPRIPGKSPRGTGCRFASAIAAHLVKGEDIMTAINNAKDYLNKYIAGRGLSSPNA